MSRGEDVIQWGGCDTRQRDLFLTGSRGMTHSCLQGLRVILLEGYCLFSRRLMGPPPVDGPPDQLRLVIANLKLN